MTRQHFGLGIASGFALVLACSSSASTQRGGDAAARVEQKASPAPAARAPVDGGDFRYRFRDVAKAVGPSVVAITASSTVAAPGTGNPFEGTPFERFFGPVPRGPGGSRKQQGIGSGVVIDAGKGLILTNNHVVGSADKLVVVLADDRELEAKVVGTDPKTDVAVIRVEPKGLTAVALGDSDELEVGDWVLAIGAPFGLRQTVSAGIVSAVGRGGVGITDYEDFIQTDAAINPGNSGGPLVDLEGRLVGINTAIASRTGGSQGIGFAIPISMAKAVVDQLVDHGSVVRGYLGVMIAELGEDLARSFGFQGKHGILVQDVSPGTPAAEAGMKAGDIIVSRDGKDVDDVTRFRNGIAATAPGTKVKLGVWRDGKPISVPVKLGELPGEPGRTGKVEPGGHGFGLALADLTPELRERFGIETKAGAVVVEVEPGSPAAESGLRPGDVLVEVGSSAVTDATRAKKLLTEAPKRTRVRILREGHGMFLLLSRE